MGSGVNSAMTLLRLCLAMVMIAIAMSDARSAPPDSPPHPDGARLEPVAFAELPGWHDDDLKGAFEAFLATCRSVLSDGAALRLAKAPPAALLPVCAAAVERDIAGTDAIRAFFEAHFVPYRIRPLSGDGFLTAYYEPEVAGSLERSAQFPVPLLGRPADLVTLQPGMTVPEGLDPGLAAMRRVPGHAGGPDRFEPYPDRAAIEDGALAGQALERIWLADAVEAFMIHVQGSARVRLQDGRLLRLTYAGRNGHPYTSIGKVLVAEGHMDLETMTLASLKGWLRAHPDEAKRIMRLNRSYIFFERNERIQQDEGPIGGAGVPLTAHRSLAVDRTIWAYGLPFFLETAMPQKDGGVMPVQRLMIAQDTGSAITGPARADYFMGSGDEAGLSAGLVRQAMHLTVLWPKQR